MSKEGYHIAVSMFVVKGILATTIAAVPLLAVIYGTDWGSTVKFGALMVWLVLCAGLWATVLREYRRRFYGAVEVALGMVGGYYAVHPDLTVAVLQIFGSVYLVVRGFENLNNGDAPFAKLVSQHKPEQQTETGQDN